MYRLSYTSIANLKEWPFEVGLAILTFCAQQQTFSFLRMLLVLWLDFLSQ